MDDDLETSVFYPRHKEPRAAVCMRSGLPHGNWIHDKILAPRLDLWSRGQLLRQVQLFYCQHAKNIRFTQKGFGGTQRGQLEPTVSWIEGRSAVTPEWLRQKTSLFFSCVSFCRSIWQGRPWATLVNAWQTVDFHLSVLDELLLLIESR